MGEKLIQPYQISIWEDRLVESGKKSYYEEVKIATIGSNTMTSNNRVYSPVFTINTNGEKTLTFSLKYKYYDETVGDFVVNPFEKFLVNERKVKLFYKNEWYDFVIKEKEEESEEYTFTYTCTDLFVQELSRNGYNVAFNTDLGNNQGTILELAERTLENTDWKVDKKNSDLLQQTLVEPVYECVMLSGSGYKALNLDTNELEPLRRFKRTEDTYPVSGKEYYIWDSSEEVSHLVPEEEVASNPKAAGYYELQVFYIFYSYVANKNGSFIQVIREIDKDKFIYDDNNAVSCTNYRFLEEFNFTTNSETGEVIFSGKQDNLNVRFKVKKINTSFQAYRLIYNNLSKYDPVLGKNVDVYEFNYDDGQKQEIYHYTETQYGTSTLLTNYITNGSNFSVSNLTLNGWSNAVVTKADHLLEMRPVTVPELTTAELAEINKLKEIKGFLELECPQNEGSDNYQYPFYNSGLTDNAAFIGGIASGEKFLLRTRYEVSTSSRKTKNYPTGSNFRVVVAEYELVTKKLADGSKPTLKKIKTDKIYLEFKGSEKEGNTIVTGGKIINNNYVINNVIQTPSTKCLYEVVEQGETKQKVWDPASSSFKSRYYTEEKDGQTVTKDRFNSYYYSVAEAKRSISQAKLSDPANRIGIFVYKTNSDRAQYAYLQDIELTKYYEDANGNPIFVGAAPEAKITTVDKFYLKPKDGAKPESVELYSSLESLANALNVDSKKIKLLKNEKSEKILSIEEAKSNCFNILQSLCETFECWLQLDVQHDELGRIKLDKNNNPIKKVRFKKYIGKENFSGFKYGINLNSINRTIDSNEFVTKLIVGQPASDYTTSGKLDIGEATSNPSGESYILNFNYYLNQGLIENREAFTNDLNKFNQDLKDFNLQIQAKNVEYIAASAALEHARSKRNVYAESADSAAEKYADALNKFQTVVGKSYAAFVKSKPKQEDIDKNKTLTDLINDIYAASVEVNNYSGLLTNINKEYNSLNEKCNGTPTYTITVTTSRVVDTNVEETTKLILSDYVEGFKCIFKAGDQAEATWESGINDKDFTDNIAYYYFQVTNMPSGYKLEYQKDGKTYSTTNPQDVWYLIYDVDTLNGLTRSFKLVPIKKTKIGLKAEIEELIEKKKVIEKEFYGKYSRFIQEGTWESTNYIDNELYYLDAMQVSNTSAQPKVSYVINVLEISELEDFNNYNFNIGDKTYIEDTDFFGWEIYTEGDIVVKTPVKEIVIVSEIEWHLDEPDINVITVQNYKTQFQDLFQRISATVQAVEYNQAAYTRAAGILDATGHINPTLLVGSLNAIAGETYNLTNNGTIKITNDGLIVRNLTEPGNLIIIKNRGIESSQDGGLTWKNLISPQGVNTDALLSGTVDTQKITILDGNNPSFRWDATGISAFSQNQDKSYDLNTYVRYDKYGLYGVRHGNGYVANSLDDIKENADFGLTWDGFFIKNKYRDGYVSISSTDDFQVVANNQERIKIGHFDSNDYGIRIKNDEGETVFKTDKDGNIIMAGTIRAAGGEIAGFTIEPMALRYGTPGQDNSILVSSGYSADLNIAGARSEFPWAFTAGNDFGVDTSGHLYARNATIEGDIYAHNGYFSGYVNARGGNFSETIQIGNGEKYILIDASPGRSDSLIASSNYIENSTAGWAINGYGDAIFNNVSVRGAIKTAVFEYNEIEAVGGAFLFRPSTTIKHASSSGNDLILTLEKPNLFQENEWVKLSNVNTESDDVNSILNDGGLTHVYRIKEANGKQVVLDGAAVDFIPEIDAQSYDSWGSVSVDAETGRNIYSTVMFSIPYSEDEESEFGHLTDYVDLTKTVGQNEEYISLNAPKYSIYFNGKSIIKTMNFDLVDNIQYHRVILQPSIEGSPIENRWYEYINHEYVLSQDQDIASGKTYYYRTTNEKKYNEVIVDDWGQNEESIGGRCIIHKYIGNLSLFWPSLTNTAESFLVAEIEFPDGEIRTRIYSDLNGEREFVLKAAESKEYVEDLEGGSLISFGFDEVAFRPFNVTTGDNPTVLHLYELVNGEYVLTEDTLAVEGKIYYKEQYEGGAHNYGIGINSSDNYVNLPERAISLFESEIHEDESIKVTYNFRGILGTLPQTLNDTYYNVYKNMAGTQGIYTDNMYIGDRNQFIAFYTDERGQKQLKIKANQIVYEINSETGEEVTWEEHIDEQMGESIDNHLPVDVFIESSIGNDFVFGNRQAILTCYVFKGSNDITSTIDDNDFVWSMADKYGNIVESWTPYQQGVKDGLLKNQIIITTEDVEMKSIFYCNILSD